VRRWGNRARGREGEGEEKGKEENSKKKNYRAFLYFWVGVIHQVDDQNQEGLLFRVKNEAGYGRVDGDPLNQL
jgi:hypothetical protein